MIARAAADDVDVVNGIDIVIVKREVIEEHVAVLDRAADGIAHGTRLLVDLLEHEVRKTAALGVLGVPVDVHGLELDGLARRAEVIDARGLEQCELTVLEKDDVTREIHDGNDVAGHERGRFIALGEADDDGAILARDRNLARMIDMHDGQAVGALQNLRRACESVDQIAVIVLLDEMGDDLGIRLALEDVALGFEEIAQLHEVLDYAVMHDGNLARAIRVRMRVRLGRATVRCPARVTDAASRGDIPVFDRLGQLFDFADTSHDADLVVRLDGDARRVVAAILELTQPFEQYVAYGSSASVTNDSAHVETALSR